MSIDYKLFFKLSNDFSKNQLIDAYNNKNNNLNNSTLSDIEKKIYKNKLDKIYKIAKKNNNIKIFKNDIIFNDNDNIIFLKNQQSYYKNKFNQSQSINKNKKVSFL